MAQPQSPVPWRPDVTFVASGAEVAPLWFAEVAWANLTRHQRLVLVNGALDWESYAVADPGVRPAGPVALGGAPTARRSPTAGAALCRAARPGHGWLAEIDREEGIHRAHALLEAMASEAVSGPEAGDDVDRAARDGPEEGSP